MNGDNTIIGYNGDNSVFTELQS